MLGRQTLNIDEGKFASLMVTSREEAHRILWADGGCSDTFLREHIGAGEIHSLDISSYEGADYLHDMNYPLPPHWDDEFSVVFDGGFLEHVFNVAQAIENALDLVKTGGHFLSMCPANNNYGHGFYQFSPELWWRVLSKDRGWDVHRIAWFQYGLGEWHDEPDPATLGTRHSNEAPGMVYLCVIAKKVGENTAKGWPQQSDYVPCWNDLKEST